MSRLKSLRGVAAAFAIIVALPNSAMAQERWPVSLEAHVGPTFGYSSDDARYRGSQKGVLVDLLLGRPLHPSGRAGVFVAIDGVGHFTNMVQTADCLFTPDGGCMPWFPPFAGVSVSAGWEAASTNYRALAGPGVFAADFGQAFGLVGRLDAAVPLLWHISATATINTLLIPSWNADRFYYVGLGAGLRLR